MTSKPTSSSSKPKNDCSKHIKGAIARMSRRYDYMFRHMKKSFMPRKYMNTIAKTVEKTLKVVVPKMVNETTDQNMKDNLPMVVSEGIKLEREKTKADIALMVADAVRTEQDHTRAELSLQVSNDVAINVPPVDASRRQDHEDHHDDDARSEGKSNVKRQITFEKSTYTKEDQGADDDEVPSKEVSQKLMAKMSGNGMKWVPTANDKK
ncbi:hypothetical protein Tco_0897721 [Tanacetum coccineum]